MVSIDSIKLTVTHVMKPMVVQVLVWKCINGTAPGYLAVASASCHQHLCSASTDPLQVTRARTMIGRWSFADAGPFLWNSLPADLWRREIAHFQVKINAYLFYILCVDEKEHPSPSGAIVVFLVILVPDKKKLLTY